MSGHSQIPTGGPPASARPSNSPSASLHTGAVERVTPRVALYGAQVGTAPIFWWPSPPGLIKEPSHLRSAPKGILPSGDHTGKLPNLQAYLGALSPPHWAHLPQMWSREGGLGSTPSPWVGNDALLRLLNQKHSSLWGRRMQFHDWLHLKICYYLIKIYY